MKDFSPAPKTSNASVVPTREAARENFFFIKKRSPPFHLVADPSKFTIDEEHGWVPRVGRWVAKDGVGGFSPARGMELVKRNYAKRGIEFIPIGDLPDEIWNKYIRTIAIGRNKAGQVVDHYHFSWISYSKSRTGKVFSKSDPVLRRQFTLDLMEAEVIPGIEQAVAEELIGAQERSIRSMRDALSTARGDTSQMRGRLEGAERDLELMKKHTLGASDEASEPIKSGTPARRGKK